MVLYTLSSAVALEQNGHEAAFFLQQPAAEQQYPVSEISSDTRRVVVEKALSAIEEIYDMDRYRFSLSPRWIPGSLQRIDSGNIRSVVPVGGVERFTNFKVSYVEHSRLKTAQIQLLVETERRLPVAGRRIAAGEVVAEEDLDVRWVSVPYDRGQLVDRVEDLSGKTIRRTLNNGEPIRHADVTTEYLVEAGDTIRLIFEQNGLRIEMEVEARQSGAQDEDITIYNKETRKRYLGKVSGPGVALWKQTL